MYTVEIENKEMKVVMTRETWQKYQEPVGKGPLGEQYTIADMHDKIFGDARAHQNDKDTLIVEMKPNRNLNDYTTIG